MLSFLKNLLGLTGDGREARELALRAEASARHLSGLPPRPATAPDDLESVLSSVCLLLDHAAEHRPPARDEEKQGRPAEAREPQLADALAPESPAEPTESAAPAKSAPPVAARPAPDTITQAPPSADGTLPVSAKELIKLRDWVLLAKSGDGAPPADALEAVYRKLGQILQKGGITSLEEKAAFDEERQQIMDTRPTDDPGQDNVVCDTVRPGYLFNGQVIRPQEVIVFTYEKGPADAPPRPS